MTKDHGLSCNVVVNALIKYYKTGQEINFNYNSEYTFNLPKTIFTSHEEILEFYEAIKGLKYGNPQKFLEQGEKLKGLVP